MLGIGSRKNQPTFDVKMWWYRVLMYRSYRRRARYRVLFYLTFQTVRYRCRCRIDTGTNSGADVHIGNGGTNIDIAPSLPKCPVPLWKSVPVPAVPVSMSYRTYRSVRYRYWCRAERTEASGTCTDVVPNLPKCPVSVIPAEYTAGMPRYTVGMPRYVPYRTHSWYLALFPHCVLNWLLLGLLFDSQNFVSFYYFVDLFFWAVTRYVFYCYFLNVIVLLTCFLTSCACRTQYNGLDMRCLICSRIIQQSNWLGCNS